MQRLILLTIFLASCAAFLVMQTDGSIKLRSKGNGNIFLEGNVSIATNNSLVIGSTDVVATFTQLKAADTVLQSNINTAQSTLQGSINTVQSNLVNAQSTLQTNIDNLSNKFPSCGVGRFIAATATGFACISAGTYPALSLCSGSLANLQMDNNNCGACGTACSAGANCLGGICGYPISCKALFSARPTTTSGIYYIDDDGPSGPIAPYQTYCLVNQYGSGWTLALKGNGAAIGSSVFDYTSTYWTNSSLYPSTPAPGFDTNEAKLQSFQSTPFTEILLLWNQGGTYRPLVIPKTATSLSAIFSTNTYQSTSIGRATWKAAIAGADLQQYCNQEGFNVNTANHQARIGIVANEQNDCSSTDSSIGVGLYASSCMLSGTVTGGNGCGCVCSGGTDTKINLFYYIFVR